MARHTRRSLTATCVAALVAAFIVLPFIGRPAAAGPAPSPTAAAQKLFTIGVLVPQEGGFRGSGEQVLKGVELAVGVFELPTGKGRAFRVAVRDCGASGETAAAALRQLAVEEQAKAVVALLGTAHAEAVAREAARLKLPLLALCKDRKLATGGFVFRNFLTPNAQVQRLAAFAKGRGVTRLAMLYPRDGYGKEMAALMRSAAPKAGLKVVAEASYEPTRSDLGDTVKKLLAQRKKGVKVPEGKPVIEAVFVPEGAVRAAVILPQFGYAGVRGLKFLGPNLWNNALLVEGLGEFPGEVYFVDAFNAASSEPAVQNFVLDYRDTFKEEPGYMAAQGYDDARLIMAASAAAAAGQGAEELARALAQTRDFPGATGLTSLDARGEAKKSLGVFAIQGRRITPAD
jgi:branched-chain amino acid transport system substrate-binding protein